MEMEAALGERPTTSALLERPLVLFDGDCGFCRRSAERWQAQSEGSLDLATSQERASDFPGISEAEWRGAVQFLVPSPSPSTASVERFQGAEAVLRIASHRPLAGPGSQTPKWGARAALAAYRWLPPVRWVTDWTYGQVAQRRMLASRMDRTMFGEQPADSSFAMARVLFLKLLALVYLCAFFSLGSQLLGLVGSKGLLPIEGTLASYRDFAQQEGQSAWSLLPTLSWLNPSDGFLIAQYRLGVVAAGLLLLGVAPLFSALACWVLYLSLVSAGNLFTSYQWDALLLEAGLLACFLTPLAWLDNRPWNRLRPSAVARWLGWLLLARLMFFSGAVKLIGGRDTNWWLDLSALSFHFETQPLPALLARWADGWPQWLSSLACLLMFAIELGAPILMFCGRKARLFAASSLITLQLLIAATGNYGFFNLLTIALCVLLLDDTVLGRLSFAKSRASAATLEHNWKGLSSFRKAMTAVGAVLLATYSIWAVGLSGVHATRLVGRGLKSQELSSAGGSWLSWASPFRSVNSYGLFASMTQHRSDIDLQASMDGEEWRSYHFHYKPSAERADMPWAGLHMPRLDWQMWFAALVGYQASPWFQSLCTKLLQGDSPEVRGLFAEVPFESETPRYIRARFLSMGFADSDTDALWQTQEAGMYITPLQLNAGTD